MSFEEPQEVHLSHYWNIILKRWKMVTVILLTVVVTAFLGSYFTKPLYRARIMLQIEREDPNRITVDDLFRIEPSSQEFLQTQYALLKSRGMADRVVKDLDLLHDPELNPRGTDGLSASQKQDVADRIASEITGGIEVKPVPYTSLVDISFTATSPRLAQKIANGIGDSYIQMTIERKFDSVRQASTFLNAEISQLKSEIDSGEHQLQKFSAEKGIVSLEGSGNLIFEKMGALSDDLNKAQAIRMEKQSTWLTLKNASADSIPEVDSNPVIQDLRADLLKLERDYEQKLSRLKPEHPEMIRLRDQIAGSRSNLNKAIQDVVTGVRESARKDYQSALAREQALQKALDEQKKRTIELNLNASDYLTLRSQISNKRNLLNELTKQLNETEVSARLKGSNSSNIHFVERAELPTSRANATTYKNLRNAVPLGLVLALAAVFFIEYMDRSIKSTEEMEKITGFASLGIIPSAASKSRYGYSNYGYGYGMYSYVRGKRQKNQAGKSGDDEEIQIDLIPHSDARSPISESYRAFRTALLLSSAQSPKVIVITSSLPREGKTTTAVNLAVVLAQMGKSIVIIDADLRKPRLKKIFGSRDHAGLVNYLAAKVPLGDVVQESQVPHLSFIECGPVPPNPSELLASDRMVQLISEMREQFDFVILDSPPVMAVTDAVILGSIADGIVLCVHGGETSREIVRRSAERLRQANLVVLGTLLNNLDLRSHGYRYPKHYYDYYYNDDTGSGRASQAPQAGKARSGRKARAS